ncbi:ATP-binding cassette domain-containing protein [Enterococcus hirae]|uniref:ATP-binding cassette domain-containing protein n=1 Tax=Enterococcus hirae TaxID=1354 RepID=UPI0013783033|nr:ABC transporter ATP-binding protein [Enterococcus hirae]NBA57117.1 ATP-binding cassette domain-containing protein [Enterococcus hirae]
MKILNLSKKFNTPILKNISIEIPQTNVSVIVGINGSGKTTLLECIVGLKKIDNGTIEINGHSNESEEFKKEVFYIPSDFYLPNFMTGYEYLNFVLKRYPKANILDIDKFFEIFNLKKDGKKLIESYSLGMKKKIQIIAATLANTSYIIGDEIFNGLDFETTLITIELFNKLSLNKGIILVSHNKMIIEKYPDNILLLANGNISPFKGTSQNLEKKILHVREINEKINFIQKYQFTD